MAWPACRPRPDGDRHRDRNRRHRPRRSSARPRTPLDGHADGVGLGVLEDVGERLLHDPVDRAARRRPAGATGSPRNSRSARTPWRWPHSRSRVARASCRPRSSRAVGRRSTAARWMSRPISPASVCSHRMRPTGLPTRHRRLRGAAPGPSGRGTAPSRSGRPGRGARARSGAVRSPAPRRGGGGVRGVPPRRACAVRRRTRRRRSGRPRRRRSAGRSAGQSYPARLGSRTVDAKLDVERPSVRQAPLQVVG